jgi:hypothetical protein
MDGEKQEERRGLPGALVLTRLRRPLNSKGYASALTGRTRYDAEVDGQKQIVTALLHSAKQTP